MSRLSGIPAVALFAALFVPAASAATYYVASDGSNDTPGSFSEPWATIQHAVAAVVPGDVIVVLPGVYREAVHVRLSGTPEAWIELRGQPGAVLESPNPDGSLTAFDIDGDSSYLTIQGFELRNGFAETVYVRPGAHHIELVGLDIHDNRNGIWISGAAAVSVRSTTVRQNKRAAIRVFNGAADVEIIDTVSENNSDGAGCSGDADGFSAEADVSNLRLERVAAVGNSEDGFDLKAPNPTLLQVISRGNGCTGMKLWNGAYVENALVELNNVGIAASGSAGSRISLHSVTVADNATGIRGNGAGYTLELVNSIVAGPGKAISINSAVDLIEDYNILYRAEPGPLIEQRDAGGEKNFTCLDVNQGTWQRDSGQGANTLAIDPEFDSTGYRCPSISSPARDSGMQVGGPPRDLIGTDRPAGPRMDRGAYERPGDDPVLTVKRLRIAARGKGRDRLRLRASLSTPYPGLDFFVGGFSLSIRKPSAQLLDVNFPSTSMTVTAATIIARVRVGSGWMVLIARRRADQITLTAHGHGLDLRAVEAGNAVVELRADASFAAASTTLLPIGKGMSFTGASRAP